jgi:outer membrane protein TolC
VSPRGSPGAAAQALPPPPPSPGSGPAPDGNAATSLALEAQGPSTPALELRAAVPPPAAPVAVTFDEALGLAGRSPSVAGAEAAAEAQRRVASEVSPMVANPILALQPGVGRDPATGARSFQGEATLLQGWNLSGLGGDRRASVRAEGAVLDAEARATALSHRLAAAQAWIELWAAEQVLADAAQEWEISSEFAGRMARAAAAAAFTRAESADAAAYAAEARVQVIQAEGEVTDRGFLLAAAMGLRAPEPLTATGPLPAPPVPERAGWEDLVSAAARLPAVAARRLAADAERAREVEVRSARGFLLGTGLKVTRDYAGAGALLAVLDLSLPVFDRGERDAAPLAAAAARSRGEHAQAAAVAATELARALHEVEHSQEVLEAVERELLPAAAESARLREASLRAGETTVFEVLLARRGHAAARARRTRALAAHAWAGVKVWLLLADARMGAGAAAPLPGPGATGPGAAAPAPETRPATPAEGATR